jgi:hypothetical protein
MMVQNVRTCSVSHLRRPEHAAMPLLNLKSLNKLCCRLKNETVGAVQT